MRTNFFCAALLSAVLIAGCAPEETMPELTDRVFAAAAAQYAEMEGRLTDETLPRSVRPDGEFVSSNIRWWCSGFYPGSLWYIYEYTGNEKYLKMAEKQLRALASDAYLTRPGENGNFILKHSVGSRPDDLEIAVPLTYADYYFLEVLLKYKHTTQVKPINN